MNFRICHMTSAHTRYDIRIYNKMCISLSKVPNYTISLIVADNKGNEVKDNIEIIDVGKIEGRLNRILKTTKKIYLQAKKLDADIYHLHDPELISLGVKLKKLGKKVIFDAHEDLPKQILGKYYLNRFQKIVLSKTAALYEKIMCRNFDYIITATPAIRDKFLEINKNVMDINNYPILNELVTTNSKWSDKKDVICYIGAISEIRGIKTLIKAMEYTNNIFLNLAGTFNDKSLYEEVKSYKGWTKVIYHGELDRKGVANILAESKAGVVTFLPVPNHIDAQPNKMFEYMSTGIPVIASNYPLWRNIIVTNKCGICVEPTDELDIANTIEYLVNTPCEAEKMGTNGIKSVNKSFNWHVEEKKLLQVYKEVAI